MSLRFLTAGESHGPSLVGILEGLPAGLSLSESIIDTQLKRRQVGRGSSARMTIEEDRVEILSGVRQGKTMGSPLTLKIDNKDQKRWDEKITAPRPGHADLAGGLKYNHHDLRNILERASARETAMRVAIGAVTRALLQEFQITIQSRVLSIGGVSKNSEALIEQAKKDGETLGGVFEVTASGLPVGLGSHVHWDRKLDGQMAQAIMSIQGIKGVEIGDGFKLATQKGSESHDAIFYNDAKSFYRKTNHAGGLEGGMTNGEDLIIRAVMKPLSTLMNPLPSVDVMTKKETVATVQRSDITAVDRTAVVAENVLAFTLAQAFLEKFGGDSMEELKSHYAGYWRQIEGF